MAGTRKALRVAGLRCYGDGAKPLPAAEKAGSPEEEAPREGLRVFVFPFPAPRDRSTVPRGTSWPSSTGDPA